MDFVRYLTITAENKNSSTFYSSLMCSLFRSLTIFEKLLHVEPIEQVDLQRYMGLWYEIARFDNGFEKGLVGVTARYSFRPDGRIRVENSGYRRSFLGKRKTEIGKMKVPDPNSPGKLKVSFFWCFYFDYYILDLDTVDYNYALVGSSSRRLLWLLSRTPQMEPATQQMLLQQARDRGYDTSKLVRVQQQSRQE